jgi:hypothetical protein
MSTVLSRWKAKLAIREDLERTAKNEHTRAQHAYELGLAQHLPNVEALKNARDAASAKLRKRRAQVAEAKKVVARHSGVPIPSPEMRIISPCQSSRGGVKPRLIVLHITVSHNRPGSGDVKAIADYFGHLSTRASSHIINDAEGHDCRCVPDEAKAWTQAAYNPQSLSIEQVEYADKPRARWLAENAKGLENTAQWVAYWSVKYDIPLRKSTSSGVCQHRDLGAAGGGHVDCGAGYPEDVVIEKAKGYAAGMKIA